MIVVDTGVLVSMLDGDDRQHHAVHGLLHETGPEWVVPWVVLPEVDYLARRNLGNRTARAFLGDVAAGAWLVEWEGAADLGRASALDRQYAALGLGLVDSVVMAVAERLGARAIATHDHRHFGAVVLESRPLLYPRDFPAAPA